MIVSVVQYDLVSPPTTLRAMHEKTAGTRKRGRARDHEAEATTGRIGGSFLFRGHLVVRFDQLGCFAWVMGQARSEPGEAATAVGKRRSIP